MVTSHDIGRKFFFTRDPDIEYEVISVDRSVLFNVRVRFTNPFTGVDTEDYFSEDIDSDRAFTWIDKRKTEEPPPVPMDHTGHKIITNSADGNVFRVCTKCKVEVFE